MWIGHEANLILHTNKLLVLNDKLFESYLLSANTILFTIQVLTSLIDYYYTTYDCGPRQVATIKKYINFAHLGL